MSKGTVYTVTRKDGLEVEYEEVYTATCRGSDCDKTIAMAQEAGGGRWHPFDPETGESHFRTCPNAGDFRGKK